MIIYDRYQYSAKKTKIKGVGVDIASIPQIIRLIERCDYPEDKFSETLTMVFTLKEQNYCHSQSNRYVCYALCFAIKEAVGKALGTGLVGIDWNEIEADLTQSMPVVCVSGQAETQAQRLGIERWLVDCWECHDYVLANVLALS